ncbi:MAG: kynureninase [Myxococcota bacterium]|nr:kynureninase [Myxococcota bacterium]
MALNREKLRSHYSDFLRPDRILLTGHSHQAWPNVARVGLEKAYLDAANHVDDKWRCATEKANCVRAAVADYLHTEPDEIALAQNSHELAVRFLSGLELAGRTVVTTDGEFHSLRRQLIRSEEAGLRVHWVQTTPINTLVERLADACNANTAALMVSTVLFKTAEMVPRLPQLMAYAVGKGIPLLLDAYHAYAAVPNQLGPLPSDNVFVTGGGYKYAQWGEGCCWMRVPAECRLRPIYTGWFSDFAGLDGSQGTQIGYGTTPADRFAGSTYDPASHYRAVEVIEFFKQQGMTIEALRETSLQQTQLIIDQLPDCHILTPTDSSRGGFVSIRHPRASSLIQSLRELGIFADSRADIIRFGPAPYTTDDEIIRAMTSFKRLIRTS